MFKLAKYVRNCVVFWKNFHSWQKFYTTAGRAGSDGRDKFQVWFQVPIILIFTVGFDWTVFLVMVAKRIELNRCFLKGVLIIHLCQCKITNQSLRLWFWVLICASIQSLNVIIILVWTEDTLHIRDSSFITLYKFRSHVTLERATLDINQSCCV